MPPKKRQEDSVEDKERKSIDYRNPGSISPFGLLLQRVSQQLNLDDCKKIATMILLPPADFDKIQHSTDLLRIMVQRDKVSEHNVSHLRDLLNEINRDVAVKEIKQYENTIFCENSNHSSDTEIPMTYEQAQETEHRQGGQTDPQFLESSPIFRNVNQILSKFGITNELGNQIKIKDYMILNKIQLKESTYPPTKIVFAFLKRLTLYDYRSVLIFKDLVPVKYFEKLRESTKDVKPSTSKENTTQVKLSCRDMIFAILNCCDPFVMQDVLSKMTHCQLAVPLLLPTLDHRKVVLLLWGLLQITKVWKDPNSNTVNEKFVVKFPFPTVSVLRVGNIDLSKSNILNKMLGPIQNNDDHPYFLSFEQDSYPSILSQGTVESVWYLPSLENKDKYSFLHEMCFLNVRGDAGKFDKQRQYVANFSKLIIVFISKSNMPSKTSIIKEMSGTSGVILVACGQGDISSDRTDFTGKQVNILDASGLDTLDIGKRLCAEINKMQSPQGIGSVYSLDDSKPMCSDFGIDVDIREPSCNGARNAIYDKLSLRMEKTMEFKGDALPLQTMRTFTHSETWTVTDIDFEGQLANLQQEENESRNRQREIGMSLEILKLCQGLLHPDKKYRNFFVIWLHHFLNEYSVPFLKPFIETLTDDRYKFRKTVAKIKRLKSQLDDGKGISDKEREQIERTVKELLTEESTLKYKLVDTSWTFDQSSLEFEHFIREFGQIYECFFNYGNPYQNFRGTVINVESLPRMVAELLLNGHPFEILNGDDCTVPIKWVKGVLSAVKDITGDDSRIYVISVIGMQTSGKSTLLNSMFGVRFAVSAGRCTRGMFLQLLPIDDELKEELSCDFIAVIDTEGLNAHSKNKNFEKKCSDLATLALCLSDLTLVNIGEETVDEDLLNILQNSAHVFIRMKDVSISPSCYFIQQCVSDVTTSKRNRISKQSILQVLDRALTMAATEEGRQDQYTQFSDCFNILNIEDNADDIPYIPNLWRTGMLAPCYEYSETILQLKSTLLREVMQKNQKQKISEFANRIAHVWKAVKQEDFVYIFRNTTKLAIYTKLTLLFKRKQLSFLQEMIKFELDAKQKISNWMAADGNGVSKISSLLQELYKKCTLENKETGKTVLELLQKPEYESIRFPISTMQSSQFQFVRRVQDNMRQTLQIESSIITNEKTKETQLLPQMKAKLRQQVLLVVERLKQTLSDNPTFHRSEFKNDAEIEKKFNLEWSNQMKDVQRDYLTDLEEDIKYKIESNMRAFLIKSIDHTGLSMEMKQLLSKHKLGELCSSSPDISTVDDIHDATTLVRVCSGEITKHITHLHEIFKEELSTDHFVFSARFLESLRTNLSLLVAEQCNGCKKMELLVCLACNILYRAYEATSDNILSTMRDLFLKVLKDILPEKVVELLELMQEDDIQKHSQIPLLQKRHVLDRRFLSLVPQLSSSKYDTILSIIADSQELILRTLFQNKVSNEIAMESTILTTMLELAKHNELAKPEQALTIAFICSWSLPIYQAMEITFIREHSMQFLLEKEREHLYSEFRDLCLSDLQDKLEAK